MPACAASVLVTQTLRDGGAPTACGLADPSSAARQRYDRPVVFPARYGWHGGCAMTGHKL